MAVEALGWVATAVFVGSYFSTRPRTLVRVQVAGALLWLGYGLLLKAPPVVVANLLVVAAASWKAWQARREEAAAQGGQMTVPSRRTPPLGTRTMPSRT
jgi:hypothetical protein